MIILVISGSPGSGKTSLSRYIVLHLGAILLSFDDILLELGDFSVENFHQARIVLVERLLDISKSRDSNLVIVDDVNHLKSLIKPYKRIAQENNCKFLHVVITLPLEVALIQNQQRNTPVSEEVLRSHFFKLNNEKFWKTSKFVEFSNLELMLEQICLHLSQSETLHKKILVSNSQKESKIHEIDLHLRKHIRNFILNSNPDKRKSVAEIANKAKKEILNCVSKMPDPSREYAQWQLETTIFKL